MLQSIFIQNYALIDKLDIDFTSGFSVITGETGAGKSIILGAIGTPVGTACRREIHQEGGFQVYRGGDFPDCQLRHGTVLSGK